MSPHSLSRMTLFQRVYIDTGKRKSNFTMTKTISPRKTFETTRPNRHLRRRENIIWHLGWDPSTKKEHYETNNKIWIRHIFYLVTMY